MLIDFRSDTFTKPGPAMLEAMRTAQVGDDVFGEDPSVNELESLAASLFGMEASIFCPSGTMTNQIAIRCHTQPGDEVICDADAHVYIYEGGGIAVNSGASAKLIKGDRGRISARELKDSINSDDVHYPHTSLVCLENTSNRGGGSCYDFDEIRNIRKVCDENGLSLHLDGARLFNALITKKETPLQYGKIFDSISVCLSKGLGCPVGSLLLGKKDFIKKARRVRKVMGGGMRQAGFLAAAGIYAINNNLQRLAEDHHHAAAIAAALQGKSFINEVLPAETNIVIAELEKDYPPADFIASLKEQNILCLAVSAEKIRLVTHLDISPIMIDKTISVIEAL